MNQEELDALPEMGGFYTVQLIDAEGRNLRVPHVRPCFALHQPENEPLCVTDSNDTQWVIGWHDGVQYKRRF